MKKASLAGAFFVSAIWLSGAQAFCPVPPALAQVQVQRVVDGDTLRLADGRSVRMIGLNSPELGRQGRSDEPFAVAARRRLETLVRASEGRVGLIPGKEGKDRYGRTLAHVYNADGQNLEAQLLAEGLGFHVVVAPNVDLAHCQRAAERQAREAGLGVWKRSPVLQAQQIRASGFAVLTGRVSGVTRNRGGIWVQLEGPVVLRVAPNLVSRFDMASLERLKGKRIEARGWVVDRSRRGRLEPGHARWLLPLTDPGMLSGGSR
ncbi:thermonuclease family protein [Pseudomonas hefeiensis]|uniref:Thermonuclease family protein n=1 Tax=Pseudomonas hefeiensis TaxID=2738125 RepID=A0ABY9GC63_9PSED|nr:MULTISPECIES: thermonuclease family protein [unclassified Pseudomonas]WLH13199.1 thermonuclease family protein [Pseudomonas sp. FP205]WLH96263.1 thermonuclease family protein [Pseudomonas sp. FP53]WLI40537.1 thermonuclease family protein [Pseudomonas sp. FP821]